MRTCLIPSRCFDSRHCADLELMLDGALEQLNAASFDKLDVAFTDGEDPVKINNEVLEKLET